jgi:hypothetical protein
MIATRGASAYAKRTDAAVRDSPDCRQMPVHLYLIFIADRDWIKNRKNEMQSRRLPRAASSSASLAS